MRIDDLNEHELGMLVTALKYWRAHRTDTETRRTDPVITPWGVDLLLAKLQSGPPTSLPSDPDPGTVTGLFHR